MPTNITYRYRVYIRVIVEPSNRRAFYLLFVHLLFAECLHLHVRAHSAHSFLSSYILQSYLLPCAPLRAATPYLVNVYTKKKKLYHV